MLVKPARVLLLIVLTLLPLGAVAADGGRAEPPLPVVSPEGEARLQKTGRSINEFGLEAFQHLCKSNAASNVVVSPLSLATALSMTAGGARGTTKIEMNRALRESGEAPNFTQIAAQYRELLDSLKQSGNAKLLIADALFANEGVRIKPGYLGTAESSFDAKLSVLDFKAESAVKTINKWCADNTAGKIKQIIDKLDPHALIVLANAVYFKGAWKQPFEPKATTQENFHLLSGATKKVSMMNQTDHFDYLQNADFAGLKLPYAWGPSTRSDSRFRMHLLLPAADSSLEAFEAKLTQDNWSRWSGQFESRRGTVSLPRFTIEFEDQLNKALTAMGMGAAFDPTRADFGDLADSRRKLFIGKVLHKTFMKVDEQGTEAAAVTAVVMFGDAMRPPQDNFKIVFDRPFYVVLSDEITGAIIFVGRVTEPR
jgi:serpin B